MVRIPIWTICCAAALAGCKGKSASDSEAGGETQPPGAAESAGEPTPVPRSLTSPPTHRLGTTPAGKGLDITTPVPEVELFDVEGKPVKLAEMVQRGPSLVAFYRGGWSPTCTAQLRAMVEAFPELQKREITPIFISVDGPDAAARTREDLQIPFPLLADPEAAAVEAFQVAQVSSQPAEIQHLEKASGRSHRKAAMPSMFLFGSDGKLVWRHADRSPEVRPSVDQMLAILDANGFAPE
jgi:peroxiredoxin